MDLSVIILNWNAAGDTVNCVRQVESWTQLKPVIWIVDNASTDESVDLIINACPATRLIANSANLGFAGGNNQAIHAAMSTRNCPILLLNNDASISEEDVIKLMETLQVDEHIGLAGPLLVDAANENSVLSAGGNNPVKHIYPHNRNLPGGKPIQKVDYIPGTIILIRAGVFKTVGLLDEGYFFGMEIADLCLRAKQRGYTSVINTQAKGAHRLARSSLSRKTLHPYYITRNRFQFIQKHYPGNILLYVFWSFYSLALFLKTSLSGERQAAQAVWLGLSDGLQGRFGGQNERVLKACLKLQDHSRRNNSQPVL